MADFHKIKNAVLEFIPEKSADLIADIIIKHRIKLTITNPRKSKKGDYRPPQNGYGHKISINGNLNKYEFLITFIHEYAHLLNWNQNGNNKKPHGEEWKNFYSNELIKFYKQNIFPYEISTAILNFAKNPASSTNAHDELYKLLKEYNSGKKHDLTLEDIKINNCFITKDGKFFQKKEKRRKRYLCLRLDNNKFYAVSPQIEVKPISKEELKKIGLLKI